MSWRAYPCPAFLHSEGRILALPGPPEPRRVRVSKKGVQVEGVWCMLLGSRARWKSRHRDSEDEQKYALHRVASRLA